MTIGGYAVTTISSKRVSRAMRLIYGPGFIGSFAALALFMGGSALVSSAHAQDAASCVAKCKSDERKCIHDGSSEELCEYDSKECQKACAQGQ